MSINTVRSWFWISPDERAGPIPWQIAMSELGARLLPAGTHLFFLIQPAPL